MRIVRFEAYNPEDRSDLGQSPTVARAWVILWSAVANHPAGNREQTALGVKVYERLKETSEPSNNTARRLKPSGAEIVLEEPEFKILQDSVAKFRENIPLAGADALLYLDKLLDQAPSLTPEQLAEREKGA